MPYAAGRAFRRAALAKPQAGRRGRSSAVQVQALFTREAPAADARGEELRKVAKRLGGPSERGNEQLTELVRFFTGPWTVRVSDRADMFEQQQLLCLATAVLLQFRKWRSKTAHARVAGAKRLCCCMLACMTLTSAASWHCKALSCVCCAAAQTPCGLHQCCAGYVTWRHQPCNATTAHHSAGRIRALHVAVSG